MIRTQISISDEQAHELRKLSTATHRSQAALMRDAIDALVGDDERSRRIERARRPVGAYRSGRTNTAEKHDEALEETFGT